MGNKLTPPDILRDYEHTSAKKLIRAIKANSRTQLEDSFEMAKKELLPMSKGTTHDKEYENMIKKMTEYLTRSYDVGEGMLFKKTPMEIAEEYQADQAIVFIKQSLEHLQKNEIASKILDEKGMKVESSTSVGNIDRDRVQLAKERLKQYQKDYENKKSGSK